jgi:predicted Zn-dependent protease
MQSGKFAEASPILRRLVDEGDTSYPVRFNLALCDLGTARYSEAIGQLRQLELGGADTAPMHNLMAQADVGQALLPEAWAQVQLAARMEPTNERMFALLMDACASHDDYKLGLRIANLGLETLPNSARLHYGKALFLAELDRLGEGRPEFALAASLGAGTDIGVLASVQSELYDDRYAAAAATARAAIGAGHGSPEILTLLGTVLLQGGAAPGQPAFEEARRALESAAAQRPQDATTQMALGTLFLRQDDWAHAASYLEQSRVLEPDNPADYAKLATAYRHLGNLAGAAECTRKLAALLREKQAAEARSLQP